MTSKKRFKKGQRVLMMGNSCRAGKYRGRFAGSCVILLDRPIMTRQRDVISTILVHESNLFPQRDKKEN